MSRGKHLFLVLTIVAQGFSLAAHASAINLHQIIQQIDHGIRDPQVFNAQTCAPFIFAVSEVLAKEPASDFFSDIYTAEYKQNMKSMIDKMFYLRLFLKERQRQFAADADFSEQCIQALRRAHRNLRFLEELLLDWHKAHFNHDEVFERMFTQKEYQTKFNPEFGQFEIKAGDVFLVRGTSFVSALVSRVAEEGSLFSHLAMVVSNSRDQLYVAEALVFPGLTLTPLETFLKEREGRLAILRYQDQALAKRAGQKLYQYIYAFEKKGMTVPYDYAMDITDSSRFYCAELIKFAFSGEGIRLPLYTTRLDQFQKTNFLKDIGVTATEVFLPSDLEVDPRFTIVAEHILLEKKRIMRIQDASMMSLIQWSLKKNYNFQTDYYRNFEAQLGLFLRQLNLLKWTVPNGANHKILVNIIKLRDAASVLENHLYAIEDNYYERNKHTRTIRELMILNEDMRKKDCQNYQQFLQLPQTFPPLKPRVLFHTYYSNRANGCELN